MKNYKKFLTTALLGLALLLASSVRAALIDEIRPLAVPDGWNQSIWVFKMMHSSPNGRYFSYVEYAGDNIEIGSPEYTEERLLTYR